MFFCLFMFIIGVKHGPILFTFFIASVMITWKVNCDIPECGFIIKRDVTLTGRSNRERGVEEFSLLDLHDTAVLFDL